MWPCSKPGRHDAIRFRGIHRDTARQRRRPFSNARPTLVADPTVPFLAAASCRRHCRGSTSYIATGGDCSAGTLRRYAQGGLLRPPEADGEIVYDRHSTPPGSKAAEVDGAEPRPSRRLHRFQLHMAASSHPFPARGAHPMWRAIGGTGYSSRGRPAYTKSICSRPLRLTHCPDFVGQTELVT